MQVLNDIAAVRAVVSGWRASGERIAFVPTMGKLHAGHLELVRQAALHARHVVVSIFVNPLQFGKNEDYQTYPADLAGDTGKLAAFSPALIFAPNVAEMYPHGEASATFIEVPGLSDVLCGAYRPAHFRGVATVVAKLFNIVQPDVALFGEKDYQQLQVIRRMVSDLAMPVEIVGIPTVREADGLAMSSRNAYLSAEERQIAAMLRSVLLNAALAIRRGERSYGLVEEHSMNQLRRAGFRPDYFSVCSARDLTMPMHAIDAGKQPDELVILAAAWLGRTRLIDNLRLALKPGA